MTPNEPNQLPPASRSVGSILLAVGIVLIALSIYMFVSRGALLAVALMIIGAANTALGIRRFLPPQKR